MSNKRLEVGDLVWTKMKNYPYWPSKIVNPPPNIKTPSAKKAQYCVFFFGTGDYAWMSGDFIVPHSDEMVLSSKKGSKKISIALQNAIDEIIEISKNSSDASVTSQKNGETDNEAEDISPNSSPKIAVKKVGKKKVAMKEKSPAKENATDESSCNYMSKSSSEESIPTIKNKVATDEEPLMKESSTDESSYHSLSKSSSEESIDSAVNGENQNEVIISSTSEYITCTEKRVYQVRKRVSITQKRAKGSLPNKSSKRKCPSPPPRKVMTVDDYATLSDNIPPFEDYDLVNRSNYIERPPTPVLDVMKVSEFLNAKDITPTDKKIGFLGLGMIGRGVVKNLILSGHKVTVWNRNPVKCEPFVKAGACKGLTPADVVASCDITFCCVSDSMAAKTLVFESCGVLKGFEGCTVGTKGYVEMTSIDPVTSLEISRGVTNLGGRYLEAPVIGSRKLAEEGSLLSLVAGDRELFNDCYSCFFAFTRNVYYLSNIVGNGSKMNIVQSMLFGTTSAALAEAMALVERCELSQDRFMEILEMTPLNCPLLVDKGNAMAMRDFTTNTALKHQQKDMSLVLNMGDAYRQSTMTTSAANNVFKRATILNYADHDVSAVIMGAQQG